MSLFDADGKSSRRRAATASESEAFSSGKGFGRPASDKRMVKQR